MASAVRRVKTGAARTPAHDPRRNLGDHITSQKDAEADEERRKGGGDSLHGWREHLPEFHVASPMDVADGQHRASPVSPRPSQRRCTAIGNVRRAPLLGTILLRPGRANRWQAGDEQSPCVRRLVPPPCPEWVGRRGHRAADSACRWPPQRRERASDWYALRSGRSRWGPTRSCPFRRPPFRPRRA